MAVPVLLDVGERAMVELMDEVVQELMDEDDEACVQLLVLEQLDDPLLM